jgi:small redox-active disulfide protein 2
MKTIHILGSGCAKCRHLHETTTEAARQLGLDCKIEKVEDFLRFADFGVMITPALVVDGKVRVTGRVPPVEELKKLLAES